MKSRTDKIKLLKGIQSGAKTIDNLIPMRVPKIFYKREEDDYYKETSSGKEYHVTNSKLHKLFPKCPIIVVHFNRSGMDPNFNK